MPNSNYPAGFPQGVTIRGVPIMQAQPGKVFWVYNGTALQVGQRGGSDGNKGTFESPFATIDYAIGRCLAGRGDVIFVKPGHAETISAAGAIALDVAGVAIVGLGVGSSRPTITMDTAASTTISVTAANVTVKNVIITANFADITAAFTTVAAPNFALDGVYIKATATNMNFLNVIDTGTVTGDMDGLYIDGCKWIEPDLATLSFVKQDGTANDVTFTNNFLVLGVNNNKASAFTIATGKIITGLNMAFNSVYRLNTDTATGGVLIVTDGSTNTGMISLNYVQTADTAGEVLVTASSGFGFFDNKESGVAGASGYLLPVADS